ncbi:MAG: DMT family transporter [Rhodospirillaceae bacterium]|nr:DMT family transporter [Rhodospirillaceae bacterium]
MPAAPPENKNATQGGAPETGTADMGRLRGRALIVPTLLLLLGGISYGGIFSANKLAASVSFPVFAYTFWIALFAGLALLIVGAFTGKLPPTSRAHLLQYLRLALLAVMLPVLATAIAARELPAGVITLVLTLVPGVTYLMSFAMRMERFEALSLSGLALGAGGVLLIVLPEQSLPEAGAWVWMLVALVAAVAAAGSNVVAAAYRPPQTHSLALACGILLAAAVVMLPVMLIADGPYLFADAGWPGIGGMAWAAAIHCVTFYCFQEVTRRAGAVFFAQFNYLVVAAGIFWALILFDETLSIWVWAALACMVVGIWLVNTGARRRTVAAPRRAESAS